MNFTILNTGMRSLQIKQYWKFINNANGSCLPGAHPCPPGTRFS